MTEREVISESTFFYDITTILVNSDSEMLKTSPMRRELVSLLHKPTNHSRVYKVYMSSRNNTNFNISNNQRGRGSET